jgi:hypothetical protein
VNEEDRGLAEAVIRRLCEGSDVAGVRFGPILQLLISDHGSDKAPIHGQVYLNLSSQWALLQNRAHVPESGAVLPDVTPDDALRLLCSIREKTITSAEIGREKPHLLLTLDDGAVLFVNGDDPQYEPWDVGVAFSGAAEPWKVIACPGGDVAVCAPQSFLSERAG